MNIKVMKRNGQIADFDPTRIRNAIKLAANACKVTLEDSVLDTLVDTIVKEINERFIEMYPNVENIQDIVEKHLIKGDQYEVAKHYILYRAKRQEKREEEKKELVEKSILGKLTVKKADGTTVLFSMEKLKDTLHRAAEEFTNHVDEQAIESLAKEVVKNLYDGVKSSEIEDAVVLATSSYIERDPVYSFMSAKLFLQKIYKEAMETSLKGKDLDEEYQRTFVEGIKKAVKAKTLSEDILEYDLEKMAEYIKPERDSLFQYLGIRTLYERYFIKVEKQHVELPQSFWMRVALGLAVNEKDKEKWAIQFYEMMSTLRYVPSTPTLFHSGTRHPQLSSCYLTTIGDDLAHIFKCMGDNAALSKWSGGLGNDWTNIRGTGAYIKSTGVESQGVIPFLKVANDVTSAINRSGKRRGATCAYLETWHYDVEEFLDLRRNTGDDRRRTHDMNTANWIPDLFMKRVINDGNWTLFSPHETPELHDLFGKKFEKKYLEYEEKAEKGLLKQHKVIPAKKLWRKMLSRLFETGHPWITFKDPCNVRSPQDHIGVVHSSNLCTEITLNTSADETAVCNLGSVNLRMHVADGKLDREKVADTVSIAMRMLDNVVDLNYYPTKEAKNSNMKHRPVGLGVMGLQDALYLIDAPFGSPEALKFCDESMELVSYYAIYTSSLLAKERGVYASYKGSKWDRGIFPIDSLKLLEEERGLEIELNKDEKLDWAVVRDHVKQYGMRNSNTMAIAPTATISNISGSFPTIEPIYKNIYVKSNVSGEFTIVNSYLIDDLKKLGLWSQEMLEQIKYHDGKLELIAGIPDELKLKYKEAFEIDPLWCIKMTATRAKWIDQSQSHNVFMEGASGKLLNDIYVYAWKMGLKTTYYLRTLAKSQIEKSTLDAGKYGFTQKREAKAQTANPEVAAVRTVASASVPAAAEEEPAVSVERTVPKEAVMEAAPKMEKPITSKLTRIGDPDCEACQ